MIRLSRDISMRIVSVMRAILVPVGICGLSTLGSAAENDPHERPLNPLESIEARSLKAFRDKPLFESSRQRFVAPQVLPTSAPVAPPPAPAPTPLPNLQLLGLIQINGGALAIVRDQSDRKVHRLRTGDIIQDWTVTIVSHSAIELARGEEREPVRMFSRHTVDNGESEENEAPPVKVPELTIEAFKKRFRSGTPAQ